MERAALEEQVMELLRIYGMEATQAAHRFAAMVEVHETDLAALELLTRSDAPGGVGELGAQLGLSSGSVTALVDRLERAGHVERVRDHADRRRVSLRVTATAHDLAAQHFSDWTAHLRAAMANRDPAELKAIAAFLTEAVAAERTVR